MLIGVLSDTHDNLPRIREAVEKLNAIGVEFVIHCGDFIAPFSLKPLSDLRCEYRGVFGNNDGEKSGLRKASEGKIGAEFEELELDRKKIFLCHFHDDISSLAGLRSIPEMPAYCASKGGLISLTQQAAFDYGRSKVRCNVICPGAVRTDMFEEAMGFFIEPLNTDIEGVMTYFSKDVPLRRVAAPEEIAGICSYLASDDSSFMTGAVIPIDGGAAIVDISGAAIGSIGAK